MGRLPSGTYTLPGYKYHIPTDTSNRYRYPSEIRTGVSRSAGRGNGRPACRPKKRRVEIVVVEDVGSGSDTVVDVEAGVNVGPAEGRNTGAASRSEGQRVHADSAEASGGKGAEGQGEEDEDEDVGKVPGVTPSGKRSREDDDDHDDLGGDDELDAKQKRVLRTSARPIRDRVIDAGSNGSISISPHRRLPQDTHQRYQLSDLRSSTLHRIRERDEDFGSEEDQDAEEPVNGVDVDAGVGVGGQATTPAEGEQGVDSEEEDPVDRRHDSPMVAGVPAVPVPVSSEMSEPPGAGMDSGRSSMSLTLTSRPSTLQRSAIILDSPRLGMSL